MNAQLNSSMDTSSRLIFFMRYISLTAIPPKKIIIPNTNIRDKPVPIISEAYDWFLVASALDVCLVMLADIPKSKLTRNIPITNNVVNNENLSGPKKPTRIGNKKTPNEAGKINPA